MVEKKKRGRPTNAERLKQLLVGEIQLKQELEFFKNKLAELHEHHAEHHAEKLRKAIENVKILPKSNIITHE